MVGFYSRPFHEKPTINSAFSVYQFRHTTMFARLPGLPDGVALNSIIVYHVATNVCHFTQLTTNIPVYCLHFFERCAFDMSGR